MSEEHKEHKANGFKFNFDMNLGHLLQILSFMVSIIVFAVLADRRFTVLELRQSYYEKIIDKQSDAIKQLSDNQQSVTRTLDRLTIIVETITKPK